MITKITRHTKEIMSRGAKEPFDGGTIAIVILFAFAIFCFVGW